MRRVIVVGAAVGLVGAAVGCGSSKALSADDYSKQVNQICVDYNAKVKEIGEPNSISGIADKGPQLADEFHKAIAKAKKLETPDELKETSDRFISNSEELANTIDELVDAAKNDQSKIGAIGQKLDMLGKTNDSLAQQLNVPACAE
jgi:uncharacterized coiled-coil DUF342 family protein